VKGDDNNDDGDGTMGDEVNDDCDSATGDEVNDDGVGWVYLFNGLTPIRVWAGPENSCPVGFLK